MRRREAFQLSGKLEHVGFVAIASVEFFNVHALAPMTFVWLMFFGALAVIGDWFDV